KHVAPDSRAVTGACSRAGRKRLQHLGASAVVFHYARRLFGVTEDLAVEIDDGDTDVESRFEIAADLIERRPGNPEREQTADEVRLGAHFRGKRCAVKIFNCRSGKKIKDREEEDDDG